MSTNPVVNACLATAYIVAIVSVIRAMALLTGGDDNVFAPIIGLSLLVLSVAVMGYLFFYQPLLLFLDGKREESVRLFLRTTGIFAGITFCIVAVSLLFFR